MSFALAEVCGNRNALRARDSSRKEHHMKRIALMSVASVCLLVTQIVVVSGQTTAPVGPPALSPAAAKVKAQVEKKGLGKEVTVIMLDGREFHGTIKIIEDETFTLAEIDLKRLAEFRYDETKKLLDGIGGVGFMGKRVHKKRSIWVGVAVVGGIMAAAMAVASGLK
jgi:hypothetical protein